MKKIPTIFLRDFDNDPKYVTEEPNPECAWVFAGEGVPTRKWDGTCVMFDGEQWWARREVKPGKTAPLNWTEIDFDETTGKRVGWEPVEQSAFAKYHAEALAYGTAGSSSGWPKGTYELVGPKVNGNPEKEDVHQLWAHGTEALDQPTLTFEGIRLATLAFAREYGAEGVVWHHPDGRMAKIKARDFRA